MEEKKQEVAAKEPLEPFGLGIYIPELWSFRQKDSVACRKLLEDLAVLDFETKRLLAGRGRRFEEPLPKACFQESCARRLIPDQKGCFLLFPVRSSEVKQAVALYLSYSAEEISAALCALERLDFEGTVLPGRVDHALFSLLSEALFYLDRLIGEAQSLPLWTVVLRAANFAGCKLRRTGLSGAGPRLASDETALFFSFLLCFFLSLRKAGGEAEAEERGDSPCYRVRFPASEETGAEVSNEPFLAYEAFQRFELRKENDKHLLVLPVRKPEGVVSSGREPRRLSILLECVGAPSKRPR